MASPDESTQTPTVETAAAEPAPRRRVTRKKAAPRRAAVEPTTVEGGAPPAAPAPEGASTAPGEEAAAVASATKTAKRATKKTAATKASSSTGEKAAAATTTKKAAAKKSTAKKASSTKAAAKKASSTKAAAKKASSATAAPEAEVVADAEALSVVEEAAPDLLLPVEPADEARPEPAEEDEEPQEAPAPVAPSFGLLFQAPQIPPVPVRRAPAAPEPPQEEPVPDETDTDTDTDTSNAADGEDSDDDGRGRRRRRRGGRGRRRDEDEQEQEGAEPVEAAEPATAKEPASTEDEGGEDDDEAPTGGRKRTRRRRRSGTATAGEDPPGTVTKVREPRKERDEATGIKGSTRLEAKRQRRREGREAGRRRTIITEAEFLARRESVERAMVVRQIGERTQIGVLEDGVLVEHYISAPGSTSHQAGPSMAGNVYLGRVQNVLPSMEAAFVDIGKGRNAVLYAGEVNWDAAGLENNKARRIENALSSGQGVLVQVTKDPIGHKGARLTSQVSLPGRYLVYVPDGTMTGISRKLPDTERARLKKILKEIVPANAGVIVRTAAEGASEAELTADVARLTKEWERIQKKAASGNAPVLLHGEPDLTVRVVRDVFNEDFSSLVVSGDDAWGTVREYVDSVAPDLAERVTKWTGQQDVFAAHRIDEQLAKAMDRKVWLPSGGSLVIDRTEAMTVIDVNTGKFTGAGGNLEETVTKNNIEAAEEIVRQLRLRDIGGIIVIDFIDMVLESNRDLVVRRLLECLGRDRTKHQVAEVTSLGLVQMTRKRVGAGLIEVFSEPCVHCNGRGLIVHEEPVNRAPEANRDGGRDANRESGRGRGRKRKDTEAKQAAPEPKAADGPTPAQIAAAAYAAAVHATEGTDEPEGAAPEGAAAAPETLAAVEQAVQAQLDTEPAAPTRRVTGRVGGRRATFPASEPEPQPAAAAPVAVEPAAEALPAPAPTPTRRRAGRRAASAPTAAPTGAEASVFTAEPAAAEPVVLTTTTVGEAHAEPLDTEPAAEAPAPARAPRRRAARRAAGAPAGPPASADAP